jgi:antitoxin MazE
MQVAKWGNSLGVRLPMALVRSLGLAEGDELVVLPVKSKAAGPTIRISKEPSKIERLQAMRRHRIEGASGFKFDRDEANAR